MKAIHVTVPGRNGESDTQEYLLVDKQTGRLRYRIIAYEDDADRAVKDLIQACRVAANPQLRVVE